MGLSNQPFNLLAFPEQWDLEDLGSPASLSMAGILDEVWASLQKPGDYRLGGNLEELAGAVWRREDSSPPCLQAHPVILS